MGQEVAFDREDRHVRMAIQDVAKQLGTGARHAQHKEHFHSQSVLFSGKDAYQSGHKVFARTRVFASTSKIRWIVSSGVCPERIAQRRIVENLCKFID